MPPAGVVHPDRRADRAGPASQGQLRSARRLLRRKERESAGRFLAEGRAGGRPRPWAAAGAAVEVLVADDAVRPASGPAGRRGRGRVAGRRRLGPRRRRPVRHGHPAGHAGGLPYASTSRWPRRWPARLAWSCSATRSATPATWARSSAAPTRSAPTPSLISAESVDALQPQDGPGQHRQPLPPARWPSTSTWPKRSRCGAAAGLPVLGADGAAEHDLDDLGPLRRAGRPDPLGARQRGLGPAGRASRAGRPAGRAADVRAGREPQPVHRRGRAAVRHRHRPAR